MRANFLNIKENNFPSLVVFTPVIKIVMIHHSWRSNGSFRSAWKEENNIRAKVEFRIIVCGFSLVEMVS